MLSESTGGSGGMFQRVSTTAPNLAEDSGNGALLWALGIVVVLVDLVQLLLHTYLTHPSY